MDDSSPIIHREELPVLQDSVPVSMPVLPLQRSISTLQQFKAISDITRSRILGIIQHQPATAKQIADRLEAAPGAIGHHLRVLEEAGLAQVVARRVTRGIIANYYTRTARIFNFDLPSEIAGESVVALDLIAKARDEMAATLEGESEDQYCDQAFPHVRLSPERARVYHERLQTLIDDLIQEPSDPEGTVYGVLIAMFRSPDYTQTSPANTRPDSSDGGDSCNHR